MQQKQQNISISVVIPTCNRKHQLLSTLQNLNRSSYPLLEVIIIDSGEDKLIPNDYSCFKNLHVHYIGSEKSVCIQRNKGIQKAKGEWVFLCDDDIEVPPDYLQKLIAHLTMHEETGAVSGRVLQELGKEWKASYPIDSAFQLSWKFIFQLSIWGEINCSSNNILIGKIKQYYSRKGNHISKAGWPVVTCFDGDYFVTPIYGLGASLVRKEWLMQAPYDEVLDRHGIGDNYGVNIGFPASGIHVLNNAFVYHHRGPENRIYRPLQYYRRALALDYFLKIKKKPQHVKRRWLLWSLTGNLLDFLFQRDGKMIRAAFKSLWIIALNKNPYYKGAIIKRKIVEPML